MRLLPKVILKTPTPKKEIPKERTFTIKEIRHYLHSQESISDALYHLTEENLVKIITIKPIRPEPENFSE